VQLQSVKVCRVLRAQAGDVVWLMRDRVVEALGHLPDGRMLFALDAEASALEDAVIGQAEPGSPLGVEVTRQARFAPQVPLSVQILGLVNDMVARALAADVVTQPEALQVLDWARDAMGSLVDWCRRDGAARQAQEKLIALRTAASEVAQASTDDDATEPMQRQAVPSQEDRVARYRELVTPEADVAVHVQVPSVPDAGGGAA